MAFRKNYARKKIAKLMPEDLINDNVHNHLSKSNRSSTQVRTLFEGEWITRLNLG